MFKPTTVKVKSLRFATEAANIILEIAILLNYIQKAEVTSVEVISMLLTQEPLMAHLIPLYLLHCKM